MSVKVSEKLGSTAETVRKAFILAKRYNPLALKKTEEGITVTWESYEYNPSEPHENVWLLVIDGETIDEVHKVDKDGDDMILSYDSGDKHCAITSKPVDMNGSQLYFTKHGWKTTMSINRDTLLSGDIYNPSSSRTATRKIRKSVVENDEYDLGIDPEDDDVSLDDGGKYYIVESELIGDVESLHGSKATLMEANDAKRLRKLLQITKTKKTQILMYIAMGFGAGIMAYPYVMQ